MRARVPAAAGLIAGHAADLLVPDPRRGHPVAGFGAAVVLLERRLYADGRGRGVALVAAGAGGATATAYALSRVARSRPAVHAAATATVTWAVLGGASLGRGALALGAALDRGDVDQARALLPALCGRDPRSLDADGLARAAVESVAENTCDAVVAPLLWGALAGVPGLVGYRAVNTLDAMVGHRSDRYRRFGWASARLDDVASYLPARVTALLAALTAWSVHGSARATGSVVRRDGARHPSPNAGRCEAAFAGALGVRLGGTNTYAGRVEHRGVLGDGPAPGTADIRRAVVLARGVGLAAVLASSLLSLLLPSRPVEVPTP